MIRRLIILSIFLLAIFYLWELQASRNFSLKNKVEVAVSFFPYAEIVKAIGGDRVLVTSLVPFGIEPHDFDPKTADLAQLYRSKLFVYNGAGFEPWADKIKTEIENNGVKVLVGSDSQDLIRQGNTIDPHIWLDPLIVENISKRLVPLLSKIDPDGESTYQDNLSQFLSQLSEIDSDLKVLSLCKNKTLVSSHQALSYLARRYGFSITSIQGLSPDSEPSPNLLSEIIKTINQQKTKYILTESLVNPKYAQTISQETGAKLLKFETIEGITPEQAKNQENYLSLQRYNVLTLKTALLCQP